MIDKQSPPHGRDYAQGLRHKCGGTRRHARKGLHGFVSLPRRKLAGRRMPAISHIPAAWNAQLGFRLSVYRQKGRQNFGTHVSKLHMVRHSAPVAEAFQLNPARGHLRGVYHENSYAFDLDAFARSLSTMGRRRNGTGCEPFGVHYFIWKRCSQFNILPEPEYHKYRNERSGHLKHYNYDGLPVEQLRERNTDA